MIRPVHQEALRSVFFVAVILVDAFIPLQLLVSIVSPFNIVGCLISLGILLFVEAKAYNRLWGKKGRWSLDKYQLSSDKKELKKG